jgi:ribose transport system permease protein
MGLPWPLVAVLVLALGALVGLINGVLVTVIGIDSFIATLGTGSVLLGINQWYTGGQQVLARLPDSFIALSGVVYGIPLPAVYVLVISIALWIVLEFLPAGRFLYVLGINPRAAQLNGISERKYVTAALIASGTLSAWAGIVLQSQLQVGQSSVGQEYLLPAFTAALLGATAVRPGRVNVWGTVLAVAVLAVTVAGLNQLGAPFFVEALFNGLTLIIAVGLAVTASKRQIRAGTSADAAEKAGAPKTRAVPVEGAHNT